MTQPSSHLFNAAFVDGLYEAFLENPSQVSPEWCSYFEQLQAQEAAQDVPHLPILESYCRRGNGANQDWTASPDVPPPPAVMYAAPHHHYAPQTAAPAVPHGMVSRNDVEKQNAVLRLINYYRVRGHEVAKLDPIGMKHIEPIQDLDPSYHGLTEADMDKIFNCGSFFGFKEATLRDIIAALEKIYCGSIGTEYMHIIDTHKKRWIQKRIETRLAQGLGFDAGIKKNILERLVASEGIETYLHTQYVGQKRFSLEGGESLIPLLDEVVQSGGKHGIKEVVIGMAHRGRLNVLVNVMGKSTKDLFLEFEGKVGGKDNGSGDVKYHQGYSSEVMTPGGPVHLTLAFNPSHLEIINPVVEGSVRARQERRHDKEHNQVLPILIHGDAAFAGQGVVMETLNLSQTRGYKTGGTVHVVVNNQIGFTTSDPFEARSTLHCTDIAKLVQAPIFHVNGDDPEAVVYTAKLALDYRMKFNQDVVIDIVCYRRHGHNETDEPFATQPIMYSHITKLATPPVLYAEQLVKENVISQTDYDNMVQNYRTALKAREMVTPRRLDKFEFGANWKPYIGKKWTEPCDTSLSMEAIQKFGTRLTMYPDDFQLHRTVERIMLNRKEMFAGNLPMDWGFAETLAYASLLEAGYPVRLSGQDCGRGTFAHRHAVLHNQLRRGTYLPLQHLSPTQAPFLVINSLLSEEAVLGFEFGYASSEPDSLVIWEAQFGDFANGAQVVFDQFISSSESKWQRLCGLAVFLPHGYDGQGPEHSSARLERYLQLCAEDNMQVCVPSTPAQFFHMIRRQMLRPYRKPLIVMTPKSLLRDKRSVSTLQDLTNGQFENVIDDAGIQNLDTVKRVLLCAGQVYFKLLDARREKGLEQEVAIIRIEQLYPFPRAIVEQLIKKYSNVKQWFWVQEEPRNQGAWRFVRARLMETMRLPGFSVSYAGRLPSASPAVGYYKVHHEQEKELLNQAFDLDFN
jgi:2-oxoglutarate dehydrogenase E1 component